MLNTDNNILILNASKSFDANIKAVVKQLVWFFGWKRKMK